MYRWFTVSPSDVIVLLQTTFFCILGGLVFILIKSRIHRQGINLIQNAQVAAIKSASIANDSSTKSSEKTITTESETNPVQRILRRNSSIVMKYCPYTSDENVVFDCPSCFAKVGVSAWHFGDKCSRMGGGCFFSLRKRMGTLLDLSEDIDAVSYYHYFEWSPLISLVLSLYISRQLSWITI